MTPSYGALDIKAEVRRSTAAAGVPYHVEDASTLDGLASMFADAMRRVTKRPIAGTTGLNASHEGEERE